jgi:hypothetical protein
MLLPRSLCFESFPENRLQFLRYYSFLKKYLRQAPGSSLHILEFPAIGQACKNTGKEAQTRIDWAMVSNPSRRCQNTNTVVKVKFTLEQATKAQRRSIGIALLLP